MAGCDDDLVLNNSVGVLLTSSEYCFVNEYTIRINDSDVNIINATGDCIIASNNTNLFTAAANGTDCVSSTSVEPYSDDVYIIQIFIFTITVLLTSSNVALHLFVKELQTVSGILIVSLCVSVKGVIGISLVYISLTDQRNGESCAVLFYMATILYYLYDSSKLSTLLHFNYVIYLSYKASNKTHNSRTILIKYATFIFILTVVCSGSIILVDAFISRTGYKTTHGRCTILIDPSNFKAESILLFAAEVSIFNAVEIVLMIVGLVLYCLTTKQCCSIPTRDMKIAIALNCTIGINTGLLVILFLFQVPGDINYAISTTGTIIEQLLLLCVFLMSSKVLSHFHCNCAKTNMVISGSSVNCNNQYMHSSSECM